jgi:ABC-type multidrug transport system ATPase subunit
VDAVSRKEFWEMLKGLRSRGITILVSTPYMDEAGLCDRVALIQNGNIMSIDSPQGIIASFKKPLYAARTGKMLDMQRDLLQLPDVEECYLCGEYSHVVTRPSVTPEQLGSYLQQKGHRQIEIRPVEPNIEDCFMDLMKN